MADREPVEALFTRCAEPVATLIERSSLGDPGAVVARAIVPLDTGQTLARESAALAEVRADRDRLAGIVAEIVDYCQHVADSNPPARYDTALSDHEGRQYVAEAVLDIIKGEA